MRVEKPLVWTKTAPTEPGYYWSRDKDADDIVRDECSDPNYDSRAIFCILRRHDGVIISDGLTDGEGEWETLEACQRFWGHCRNAEFAGPIPFPEEPRE